MPAKRFQGHWKDLLAEKRQPASRGTETKPAGRNQKSEGEAEPRSPASKAGKPKSQTVREANVPAAAPEPITADYEAKLRAAALIGLSQRAQTTGPIEPPSGILAEIMPVVNEGTGETGAEPRFRRLRAAMRAFHRYRYVSLAVSLATLFLCLLVVHGGDQRPVRVPVSGQVLLDGKPLTHGMIVFVPQQGRASTGSLDEQGRYMLTCFDGHDGTVPGKYRVEIAADGVPAEGDPPWPVPVRYSRCTTSGLTAEITARASDVDFKLTSEGRQPAVKAPGPKRQLRPEGKQISGR